VSVSYLVYKLFLLLVNGITIIPQENFSNYVVLVKKWSPEAISFEESIQYFQNRSNFPPKPPPESPAA